EDIETAIHSLAAKLDSVEVALSQEVALRPEELFSSLAALDLVADGARRCLADSERLKATIDDLSKTLIVPATAAQELQEQRIRFKNRLKIVGIIQETLEALEKGEALLEQNEIGGEIVDMLWIVEASLARRVLGENKTLSQLEHPLMECIAERYRNLRESVVV